MIKILGNKQNVIIYECSCGVKGKCMVKPQKDESTIVVDVRCPVCLSVERVVLMQYKSDEEKSKIKKNLNDVDLSWSSVSNEVVEFLSKEEDDDE